MRKGVFPLRLPQPYATQANAFSFPHLSSEPIQRLAPLGGVLLVQKGVCRNDANPRCQLLFVAAGERFLTTEPDDPVGEIINIRPGVLNTFAVTYRGCAPGESRGCTSRNPTTSYCWTPSTP